jgi:predicted nucleotidyltransferase
MLDISKIKHDIEHICRSLPVKRLGLFGSVLREDFSADSDVDALVVFDDDQSIDLFEGYFDLKERLEKIFGREVDIIIDKPFRNPVFRESVEKSRVVIYER